MARTNPVYYDKQRGTFAWYDIDSRKYGSGHSWPKPKAADGLLQLIDENEVAAMLWALSDTTMPALTQEANEIFFDALESPVVKKELGEPYGRGYKTTRLGSPTGELRAEERVRDVPAGADVRRLPRRAPL